MKKLFNTKGVYMTRGINESLKKRELNLHTLSQCLSKHFFNDGEECKEDRNMNQWSIDHMNGRVISVFNDVNGHKIYIITEGLHLDKDPEHGKDYPMTTVLFPEEY